MTYKRIWSRMSATQINKHFTSSHFNFKILINFSSASSFSWWQHRNYQRLLLMNSLEIYQVTMLLCLLLLLLISVDLIAKETGGRHQFRNVINYTSIPVGDGCCNKRTSVLKLVIKINWNLFIFYDRERERERVREREREREKKRERFKLKYFSVFVWFLGSP